MHAQVVVLTYQSPGIDSYTYKIPDNFQDEIKIGQLVSIPFGKRNPLGIILSIDNQPRSIVKNIKPISSIIFEKPILLPYQINILKWLSDYYIAPMVNCLEAMIPEIPKRLSNYKSSTINDKLSTQTLILVPSINHLPQVMSQFPEAKNHVLYTNELKTSEKFIVWQKILSGQSDFIFGSRSAIFSPCPNLKKIIIFEEHDSAYKDNRSPYFDTVSIAEKISELTNAELKIIDTSPRISTYSNHTTSLQIPNIDVQTRTISLENDRRLGNYSPISIPLEEIIKRAYAKKLSVLLFLNKKIESGSIYCKSCKHQEFFKSQPEVCPNCQSPEIFFNSTNINSLAKELKKILPEIQINIISEDAKTPTADTGKLAIDIATSSVFYKLMTKRYDLVAHIYADSPLNFNEYNSAEEIYTQIVNLKKLTKRLLVIQTYNPTLPAIKFASSANYADFYKNEIGPRKILNYPPFSLIVKIMIKGKSETKAESNVQQLFEKIKQSAEDNRLTTISILGPYKSFAKTVLSYNISLKIPISNYSLNSREKALDKIRMILKVQKDVKIIVEPKNLN